MGVDWTTQQRKAFSELFRTARARLGLTQAAVAEKTGVDKGTVLSLEQGPYAGMRTPDVLRLAAFYGINPVEIASVLGIDFGEHERKILEPYEAATAALPADKQELVLRTLDAVLRGLQER